MSHSKGRSSSNSSHATLSEQTPFELFSSVVVHRLLHRIAATIPAAVVAHENRQSSAILTKHRLKNVERCKFHFVPENCRMLLRFVLLVSTEFNYFFPFLCSSYTLLNSRKFVPYVVRHLFCVCVYYTCYMQYTYLRIHET